MSAADSVFVIHGATGDLSRRKLLPSLYRLAARNRVEESTIVLGVGRDDSMSDESFRSLAAGALRDAGVAAGDATEWCRARLFYQSTGTGRQTEFESLRARISDLEREFDLPGNRVFYLALPPRMFEVTVRALGQAGLSHSAGWTRLVIEKPVGRDLETARALNGAAHEFFTEDQVYRIDHYLGKETVQNLLVFRFANSIFESLWNRDRIETVQITIAESLGVGSRAGYYDHAGALRDMVQNHITQLLSLVAMEVPVALEAAPVRYEKIKLLKAIAPIPMSSVVYGQYGRGVIEGEPVAGYLDEAGIEASSTTPTFVALKLAIDTWRWQGVPFYVRTGKRMARRLSEITVTFRKPPVSLFEAAGCREAAANVLRLTLQPDEGFSLCFEVKAPGEPFSLRTEPLDFLYREAFGPIPDAYETLLLDVLTGDQTLFVHAEEAAASWKLYGAILDADLPVHAYDAGSWGPDAANELLERDGHRWQGPIDMVDAGAVGGDADPC